MEVKLLRVASISQHYPVSPVFHLASLYSLPQLNTLLFHNQCLVELNHLVQLILQALDITLVVMLQYAMVSDIIGILCLKLGPGFDDLLRDRRLFLSLGKISKTRVSL